MVYTPDVEQVLQWFELTHTVQLGFGMAIWQQTTLPFAGGLNEQPAVLMEALALVRREKNAALMARNETEPAKGRRRNRG